MNCAIKMPAHAAAVLITRSFVMDTACVWLVQAAHDPFRTSTVNRGGTGLCFQGHSSVAVQAFALYCKEQK